jgi:hypothetical protein
MTGPKKSIFEELIDILFPRIQNGGFHAQANLFIKPVKVLLVHHGHT